MLVSLTPRTNRYIPHDPTVIPQQAAFLLLTDDEALYGGAAGGGKTDALLMGALQDVEVPGYSAMLFRRTFPELRMPDSLLDRADVWLHGTDAHWSGLRSTWYFPSGARVTFGYLQHDADKHRYQSAAFQYIGFDELTTFTEAQYTYLFSRLRKPEGMPVRLRMRAGSNPGGPGHDWVRQRFLVENRTFIPARLEDNPFLDREAYMASLAKLDPVTRRQLLEGDWEARQHGNLFQRERAEVVEVSPPLVRRIRRWDLAGTEAKAGTDPDWTASCLMGLTKEGTYVVLDVTRQRTNVGGVEQAILNAAVSDGRSVGVRIEREPGSAGLHTIAHYVTRLRGYDVKGIPSTGSKEERARPFAAQWYAGNVLVLRGPWYNDWIQEMEVFPQAQSHDDQVDCTVGAFEDLTFTKSGILRTYG